MARITVEDCLHKCANRFELTMVAAKRARQLSLGKDEPRVEADNDKFTVIALREIAGDLITLDMINEIDKRPSEHSANNNTPPMEDEDF